MNKNRLIAYTTTVAACLAIAGAHAAPAAHAQAPLSGETSSPGSSTIHGDYPVTGSSVLDASSAAGAASSLSSGVPLPAGSTLALTEIGQGLAGSALYGSSSQVPGSSLSSRGGNAAATFPDANAPAGELLEIRHIENNVYEFDVYSPSMDRVVTNDILLPVTDGDPLENATPRPTFYLLLGADGASGGWSWYNSSQYQQFFADKQVNVVTPKGSVSSMQADWYENDPVTGNNKWSTYLTKELPPVVDAVFAGTGRDAIGGISMSGGPAINIASLAPERFAAAASYSGCPATTGLVGGGYTSSAVWMNGGDPTRMWGWPGDAAWDAHSPVLNLDRLQSTALFVSAAQGLPGAVDNAPFSARLGVPSIMEGVSYACSANFAQRADEAGLDVEFYPRADGTHTWGIFEDAMRTSWHTTIGPALGVH